MLLLNGDVRGLTREKHMFWTAAFHFLVQYSLNRTKSWQHFASNINARIKKVQPSYNTVNINKTKGHTRFPIKLIFWQFETSVWEVHRSFSYVTVFKKALWKHEHCQATAVNNSKYTICIAWCLGESGCRHFIVTHLCLVLLYACLPQCTNSIFRWYSCNNKQVKDTAQWRTNVFLLQNNNIKLLCNSVSPLSPRIMNCEISNLYNVSSKL